MLKPWCTRTRIVLLQSMDCRNCLSPSNSSVPSIPMPQYVRSMNSVGTLGNAALTSRATYAKSWLSVMRPSITDTTVTTACMQPRPDPPESKNCPRSAHPSAGDGA